MPTYYAKTFAQIVEGAQRLAGDYKGPMRDGRVFLRSEVESRVNDVVLELAKETEILKEIGIVQLSDGVSVYDLPGDCLRPLRLMMHGAEGWVVLPTTLDIMDRSNLQEATGDAVAFFRQCLQWNQIGVIPAPKSDGSSFTRDSDYGIIRRVTDADGNEIPMDADTGGLRNIRGIPFAVHGDGGIIRQLISPYGNLEVNYVRSPKKMTLPGDYPDPDIPEWIHKDLKFAAAARILKYRRERLAKVKVKAFTAKWMDAVSNLRRWTEQSGTAGIGVVPQ